MRYLIFGLVLLFVIFTSGLFTSEKVLSEKDLLSGRVLGASEARIDSPLFSASLPLAPAASAPAVLSAGPILKNEEEIDLLSPAAVVIDCSSGQFLYEKKSDLVLPIASVTKLATALTFMDLNPGWDKIYRITEKDWRSGGRENLRNGEEATVKDLFYLSLVASDNTATVALVHSTGLTEEEFVGKMNAKMAALGLDNTRFADPVGLSHKNTAPAREIAELAIVALDQEDIRQATLEEKHVLTIGKKTRTVNSTDALLKEFPQNGVNFQGGKTGYIKAAGYCFAGKFSNQGGREIVTVVLGSNSSSARFKETKRLAHWVFDNYVWSE